MLDFPVEPSLMNIEEITAWCLKRQHSTVLKSNNLQYNTMEKWIDGTIVTPSDGPRFILIDWE